MKRAMGHTALSASLLGRLSGFDIADVGTHASLLFRELITSASARLPASTIILAAAIVDIVQHEQAGGFKIIRQWPKPAQAKTGAKF